MHSLWIKNVDFFIAPYRADFPPISPIVGKIFLGFGLLNRDFSVNPVVIFPQKKPQNRAAGQPQHIIFQINAKQSAV